MMIENPFDEMRNAVSTARAVQQAVDMQTATMANMISGRLRKAKVPNWLLSELKRELRDWNARTRKWK